MPSWPGRKGPYVTPRTYSFPSPTKRNFPRTRGRSKVRGERRGLVSRVGDGMLNEFLSPANGPYGKSTESLKSHSLPPVGCAFSRLPAHPVFPTTSAIPSIARQFERSFPDLNAVAASSAAPWPGNIARPTQAGPRRDAALRESGLGVHSLARSLQPLDERNVHFPCQG